VSCLACLHVFAVGSVREVVYSVFAFSFPYIENTKTIVFEFHLKHLHFCLDCISLGILRKIASSLKLKILHLVHDIYKHTISFEIQDYYLTVFSHMLLLYVES
jgi:hypothetical protein